MRRGSLGITGRYKEEGMPGIIRKRLLDALYSTNKFPPVATL